MQQIFGQRQQHAEWLPDPQAVGQMLYTTLGKSLSARSSKFEGCFQTTVDLSRRLVSLCTSNYVDLQQARTFSPANLPELGAFIVPDFLTQQEHNALVSDSLMYLQARKNLADRSSESVDAVPREASQQQEGGTRYEEGHWDGVIHNYKEVAVPDTALTATYAAIAARVRSSFPSLPSIGRPKPQVHVLELGHTGAIASHVDSVKFSGGIVAGVCLLSDCVMLLQHVQDPGDVIRLFLPQRSLYMLTGPSRYNYGHSIPVGTSPLCTFNGQPVVRGRRISLIFRDELPDSMLRGPTIIASGSLSEVD